MIRVNASTTFAQERATLCFVGRTKTVPEPLAIVCSDIHLSHTPPAARAAEPDWYAAQARVLEQLVDAARVSVPGKKGTYRNLPILCAGDVFDRWNSQPELINFAINVLPKMYAIPGQHDLPYHRNEDIYKSAYWTLVEEGTIDNLGPDGRARPIKSLEDKMCIHGFWWGRNLHGIEGREDNPEDESIYLALIHRYVWQPGYEYQGAPTEARASGTAKQLAGFDVAVFGDNHAGFEQAGSGSFPTIYNCGGLIRRKQDERHYKPAVGILMSDGTVERHYLDTSEDKWVDSEGETDTAPQIDLQEFLADLEKLEEEGLDFEAAVRRWIEENKPSQEVERLLLSSME